MTQNISRKNFFVPQKAKYICENCGAKVIGGRYNNHCPKCLWSKHVDDLLPGDRSSKCKGLMQPIDTFQKGKKWRIVQKCTKCQKLFTVDSAENDNFDEIIRLSQNPIPIQKTKRRNH